MKPRDCPTAKDLADFHSGRLATERLADIARHLDRCDRCLAGPQDAVFPLTERDNPPTRFDAEAGCRRAGERVAGLKPSGPVAGAVLGDFRLLRVLGQGGMGVVYEAEQRSLSRRVAVKVLHAREAGDPQMIRRFEREAKAVGRLHHTNIVPVFGVGEFEGSPYYAMQLIRGVGLNEVIDALSRKRAGDPARDTLADRVTRPITLRDVAQLMAQAADGIGHAHEQGILHRDIKPSNLLRDTHGTVWVTDFGLAKTDDAADLTDTGDVLGTVRYLAPEAFEGKADTRSDVYALGLTLYELLATKPAYAGTDRGQVMKAVMDATPIPLRRIVGDIPRDLETIVAKAIDRDPARRYPTAGALAEDLRRFVRDEPILARRIGPVELFARWAKRNRGLAASLLVLAFVLVGVSAASVVAAGTFHRMASDQTDLATREATQRREAVASENEARDQLYAAEMSVAARIADQPTGLPRLRELVAHWATPAEGRPDPRGWEWRLFRSMCHTERLVRTDRNFGPVAWSRDGRRVALAGDDSVEVIESASDRVVRTIPVLSPLMSLTWAPSGRHLIAGHLDGWVSVLDADTGRPTYRARHGTNRTTVCVHPAGNWLASHGEDGSVRVHDLAAGTVVAVLPGALDGPPSEFSFSPDGRRLATAHYEEETRRHVVALWRTADWSRSGTVSKLPDVATSIRWADDRNLLLATGSKGVFIWDASADSPVRTLVADRHLIACLDVTPDGRRVVAGDWGRTVWVWDVATGQRIATFRGHTASLYRVAIAPDGSRIATVSLQTNDSALRVWDVGGRHAVRTYEPAVPGVDLRDAGLAWHPDGRRIAAAVAGPGTAVYDVTGGPAENRKGTSFRWDASGKRAVAGLANGVFVYDDARADPVATYRLRGMSKSFAWHPTDGRLAIRVGLQLWLADPARSDPPRLVFGTPDQRDREAYEPCGALAWEPSGKSLVLANRTNVQWTMNFFDSTTGTAIRAFPTDHATVFAVAWSPDGHKLAVAGDNPAIPVYDPETGRVVQTLRGHTFTVRDLAYSPDGRRLASCGLDGNVILWDPATGRMILTFELNGPVLGVSWSPDGTKLAALLDTGAIKVWDAGTSNESFQLRP